MNFEWDDQKAKSNLAKHGVTFEEAVLVFGDPLSLTIPDPEHSLLEDRYITLRVISTGRFIVVVHADREDRIWIISAREATRKEMRDYEQGYH